MNFLIKCLLREKLIYLSLVHLRLCLHLVHKHWSLGASTKKYYVQTLGTPSIQVAFSAWVQGQDLVHGHGHWVGNSAVSTWKKGVFTLVQRENRTWAPWSGIKCEHSLTVVSFPGVGAVIHSYVPCGAFFQVCRIFLSVAHLSKCAVFFLLFLFSWWPCTSHTFPGVVAINYATKYTIKVKAKFSYCDQIKFNEPALKPGIPE